VCPCGFYDDVEPGGVSMTTLLRVCVIDPCMFCDDVNRGALYDDVAACVIDPSMFCDDVNRGALYDDVATCVSLTLACSVTMLTRVRCTMTLLRVSVIDPRAFNDDVEGCGVVGRPDRVFLYVF
jgi:hypothetical protein